MNVATSTPSNETDGSAVPSSAGSGWELDYGSVSSPAGRADLVVIALLWVAGGCLAAGVLARRGHRLGWWTMPALLLGPLLLAGWAVHRARRDNRPAVPVEVAPGDRHAGRLSLLIAVLDAPEHVADAHPVLRKGAGRWREIVLVRPISVEAALAEGWDREKDAAARALSQAALFVSGPEPRLVLVPGRGATAVARFAREHRPDLVIVAGGQAAKAALCLHPALGDPMVMRAAEIARSRVRREPHL